MYDIVGGGYAPVEIMGDDGEYYAGSGFDFVGDALDQLLAISGAVQAPPKYNPAMQRALAQRAAPRMPYYPAQSRPGVGGQFSPAMMQALAMRRAMSGSLMDTRGPTKAREYPLGFASATTVAAGASAVITAQPQVPFRIDRLVVPSDIAGLFTIDDLKVGKNSNFAATGSVPARIFQENGVGVTLKGDTAQVSMLVTINVTNISGGAATFRAAVIGPAVE